MDNQLLLQQFDELLDSGQRGAYVFRTRLERTMIRVLSQHEQLPNGESIFSLCNSINDRISYISDRSYQSPDGILSTYNYFRKDIQTLKQLLQ
ncbi:hypothetical protein [Cohnella endophytica]|uniref:hypothetical protein n=1 Tax=Cohnella endophytica TaxID=2419778 RepID=UPI0011C3B5F0|nr:hypothetical protein [Cohnella endophytica]